MCTAGILFNGAVNEIFLLLNYRVKTCIALIKTLFSRYQKYLTSIIKYLLLNCYDFDKMDIEAENI